MGDKAFTDARNPAMMSSEKIMSKVHPPFTEKFIDIVDLIDNTVGGFYAMLALPIWGCRAKFALEWAAPAYF
jgi:hypothetical protein